ncbi:MAG: aminomethyl-transferring glycine dehydrogenase subunit GcvPA [Candidatus Zixiibacteriota bacterium]|nr:MAG: aminomethyl-transferring glycine dehydrogenase subunit GcvPA [candidate division Zixibacteria bacterium]
MPYIPNTDDDRRAMLDKINVKNISELFSNIPEELRLKKELNIPALSEMELLHDIQSLAKENNTKLTCFAGGGIYDHFIPSAINNIASRPEFVTAYTPYQPEVAQGTLQIIYEFQTHICRLTGMDIANASMYDGASAAAEAIILSSRVTKRDKAILSETVNPLYREVIQTYLSGHNIELITVPLKDGLTDFNRMADLIDESTACVLLGQPNFFGYIEDVQIAAESIHKVGGKMIMSINPISQAILTTPAESGADIVVGEGQPLGLPISFGGPLLGFFAVKKDLARQIPGRIAGRTKDVDGKDGFVLTLQTREQHIRREKATSNICTNQALCATIASVYCSLLGKTGLKKVALLSLENAHNTAEKIFELDGYEPYFNNPYVNEFAVKTPIPAQDIISQLVKDGVLPGIDAGRWYSKMDNCLIIAATEKRTDEDINKLINRLESINK